MSLISTGHARLSFALWYKIKPKFYYQILYRCKVSSLWAQPTNGMIYLVEVGLREPMQSEISECHMASFQTLSD
jgi:hypothetical protein